MRTVGIAAALLMATGCIVVGNGGGGGGTRRGDLTVFYLFGGSTCTAAGATRIDVVVTGVSVSDGATKNVDCAGFPEGITIRDFLVGTYDVRVTGKSSTGRVLYRMTSTARVTVRANDETKLDVDVPGSFGDLTVYWGKFGTSVDCSTAGIADIRVALWDPAAQLVSDQVFTCADGGVIWEFLDPGNYDVVLEGLSGGGEVYYSSVVTQVPVEAGIANEYVVDLELVVGSVTLTWTFGGSGVCGNISKVRVVMVDPWDTVFDDSLYDCSFGGVVYDDVAAGTWTVTMEAQDATGLKLYRASNRTVDVVAGSSLEYGIDLDPI